MHIHNNGEGYKKRNSKTLSKEELKHNIEVLRDKNKHDVNISKTNNLVNSS